MYCDTICEDVILSRSHCLFHNWNSLQNSWSWVHAGGSVVLWSSLQPSGVQSEIGDSAVSLTNGLNLSPHYDRESFFTVFYSKSMTAGASLRSMTMGNE